MNPATPGPSAATTSASGYHRRCYLSATSRVAGQLFKGRSATPGPRTGFHSPAAVFPIPPQSGATWPGGSTDCRAVRERLCHPWRELVSPMCHPCRCDRARGNAGTCARFVPGRKHRRLACSVGATGFEPATFPAGQPDSGVHGPQQANLVPDWYPGGCRVEQSNVRKVLNTRAFLDSGGEIRTRDLRVMSPRECGAHSYRAPRSSRCSRPPDDLGTGAQIANHRPQTAGI